MSVLNVQTFGDESNNGLCDGIISDEKGMMKFTLCCALGRPFISLSVAILTIYPFLISLRMLFIVFWGAVL